MSRNAPQTLSVKRKRHDVPPDSLGTEYEERPTTEDQFVLTDLVVEQRAGTPSKRLKSDIFASNTGQDSGESVTVWILC
jgi:hypothetical protein